MSAKFPRELTPLEAGVTDGVATLADIGGKVLHPGGRRSTEQLFDMAQFEAGHKSWMQAVAWEQPRLRSQNDLAVR